MQIFPKQTKSQILIGLYLFRKKQILQCPKSDGLVFTSSVLSTNLSILAPRCLLVIFHTSKHIESSNLRVLALKFWIQLCWFWSSRIYPMEVGYIRPDLTGTVLEPDRWSDMSDASDISTLSWIYPIWSLCQGCGTWPEAGYVYIRSDISGLELVPRFWNPMKIFDQIRYIQYNWVLPNLIINAS
jgi:hypothetical protein